MQYDLIVIGGGPAGYVGAIRAAQMGKTVACVERDRVGGTCLNWGCIPTKALLKNAEAYLTVTSRAKEFGMTVEGVSVDWSEVIGRSRKVSDRLAGGVGFLFKKNKVESVTGEASITAPGKVEVKAADGTTQVLEGKNILISTGCVTRSVPSLPLNGTTIIGSREAMVLEKRPESTGFQFLCDRSNGDGLQRLDRDISGGSYGDVAVAEEGAMRVVGHIIISGSKGVIQADTSVGNAQVFTVATSFRTVHATNLSTVAVIEQLCGKAGQHCSLGSFEYERGYTGTVLPEVHH